MEAAGVLGAIMIGTLIANNMSITIALQPSINGAVIDIQSLLDTIMPGLLTLLTWWGCFKWIQKGMTPIKLTFIIMGACIVLSFFGIL